ncbi:head maturation protease [Arthrobacter phage KBurrousTX]|uniref:MuF-like minor capsid protein n=1 Tax=Arthrobacter phage KBurrousTX TaxID=2315608 RepID=A0A386K8C3_9CAUD|nr:head maturation protease [Arthrobacter phage KBurrousTX]AYD81499.1 MuF-like minor capsid protein [Arthrobacter phage KBurrousTX]
MCQECDAVLVAMEETVLLAEAERTLIDAEIAAGENVPAAVRPLLPHEAAAKVRFGDIEKLTNDAVDEAAAVLDGLREVIVGSVVAEMLGDADSVTPTDATRAIAQLNAAQPKPVQEAVAKTAMALQGILAQVAAGAAGIVVGEAARQGVNVKGFTPTAVADEVFKLPAAAAALHPWQRITGKLQTVFTNPSGLFRDSIPREEITRELDKIPVAGSVDMAKQAVHAAHGLGRNEAAQDLNPSEIFASEIMDGNTCKFCKEIDGHEYQSLEDALTDYPHGGYRLCEGGTRCRGTLVYMYDEPATPRDDPNPEPLPPIPPAPKPAPKPVEPEPAPEPKPTPAPDPGPVPVKYRTRKEALAKERAQKETEETPGLPAAPTGTPPKRRKGQTQRYTALDQLPVDHELTRDTPMLVAAKTNPGHDKSYKTKVYNNNCTSVANAYEFQRRGYDVKAAPVPGGKGRFEREYVEAWWRNTDGTPARYTTVADLPWPKGLFTSHGRVRAQLAEWGADFPDGARGFIQLQWTGGGGHVFNWEKVGGSMTWLEGQTGSWDASGHLADGKFKPLTVKIIRMDDKTPLDIVTQAFENRPPEYLAEVAATGGTAAALTSAEKKAKSKFRIRNGIEIIAPEFRKGSNGRWEPIPEAERKAMLEEFYRENPRWKPFGRG